MRVTIAAQLDALLPFVQGVFWEILTDFLPNVPFDIDTG
jgi:hypothetical protein